MNTLIKLKIHKLFLDKGIDNMPIKSTIADVVMWLYENHGIWIEVIYWELDNQFQWKNSFRYGNESFNTPTEAYESAIVYCLTEIIK